MIPSKELDLSHLARHFPALTPVRRGRITWDDFGRSVVRDFHKYNPRSRHLDREEEPPETNTWTLAKHAVHEVITGSSAEYASIRRRLRAIRVAPTPALLTLFGVWLSGKLDIAISSTTPMVAAMLYGVASSPSGWDALVQDDGAGAPPPEQPDFLGWN